MSADQIVEPNKVIGHTPGPWFVRTAYNGDCGISAYGTGVFAEAFADIRFAREGANGEAAANARLIAAAPDLLCVLQRLCKLNADGKLIARTWGEAEAAIAKATGAA